jgi:hypothetical protein
MSRTWSEQLELLQALLSTSLDYLFIPSEPTSSISARTHISSTTAPSSSPSTSLHPNQSPLPNPLSPTLPSTVAIPSSSLYNTTSTVLLICYGIEGAKHLSQIALNQHPSNPSKSSPSNPFLEETLLSAKVKLLTRKFRLAGKVKQVDIHQKAREEGIYALFQRYLSHPQVGSPCAV